MVQIPGVTSKFSIASQDLFWPSRSLKIIDQFYMRVVILNHGPRLIFGEIFDVSRKSEPMSAPFFWERHETYGVILEK